MKKHTRSAISLLLLFVVLTATLVTAQAVEARFTGVGQIASALNISDTGAATCSGRAVLYNGYTADMTVELKQDGTTIKTWETSGNRVLSAGGTYYVMSGHNYVVTTTVTVYDSDNNVVETPSANSIKRTY